MFILPPPPPPLKANVHIDGFNLYHGCFDDRRNLAGRAHWRAYRWLDLGTLCGKLFSRYAINHIRYFTALVDPLPNNPDNRARQLIYLRALETIPHLTVHLGRFATNAKDRPLADPRAVTPTARVPLRLVRVIEREEKGSDVNLASYLLLDGFQWSSGRRARFTPRSGAGELVAEEEHTLRTSLYFRDELLLLLAQAGFGEIEVRGGYTEAAAAAEDPRLVFIARK